MRLVVSILRILSELNKSKCFSVQLEIRNIWDVWKFLILEFQGPLKIEK